MTRPRVVILRALGIGDLLAGVPALRALAEAFGRYERVLAAPGALAPLVDLIDVAAGEPAVDRLVPVGELEPLPPDLRRAEVAVNLHGRGPQSHQLLLASRPRKLLCFENPQVPASRGSPHWRPGEHEVSRWCRMLAENGIPADPTRLRVRPPAGGASEAVAGAVVIHPGAASAARRWPPQRFAAVARAQVRQGRPVVITGSAAELPLARSVAGLAKLPEGSVLAGKTDLKGLAQVVATARAVICGDTGVGHLATALGTPSVLLFGPTPPCEWGPPAAARRHRVLWAGQVGDPHGEQPSPGLMGLTVDRVLRALETVMVAA